MRDFVDHVDGVGVRTRNRDPATAGCDNGSESGCLDRLVDHVADRLRVLAPHAAEAEVDRRCSIVEEPGRCRRRILVRGGRGPVSGDGRVCGPPGRPRQDVATWMPAARRRGLRRDDGTGHRIHVEASTRVVHAARQCFPTARRGAIEGRARPVGSSAGSSVRVAMTGPTSGRGSRRSEPSWAAGPPEPRGRGVPRRGAGREAWCGARRHRGRQSEEIAEHLPRLITASGRTARTCSTESRRPEQARRIRPACSGMNAGAHAREAYPDTGRKAVPPPDNGLENHCSGWRSCGTLVISGIGA